MAVKALSQKKGWDSYLKLVRRFPLRPIQTEAELDQAIEVIDALLDKGKLDPGEADYLDVLSDLVEGYEEEAFPQPEVPDADMLRFLMEAKGVNQKAMVQGSGIATSTISAVLAGKRLLNRSQIGRLAKYFLVEPGVFSFGDAVD